jgi:hypothetical protein
LGSFQNYKFLEDYTKIPCFINNENSKVNRRHLLNDVQNWVEMRKKWMVNTSTIYIKSTQNHTEFILYLAEKNHLFLGLFSTLLYFVHLIWADPSHMFLSFVKWAKIKIWKWNCGVVRCCLSFRKTLPVWLKKSK